jgi:hypothetical protein
MKLSEVVPVQNLGPVRAQPLPQHRVPDRVPREAFFRQTERVGQVAIRESVNGLAGLGELVQVVT